MSISTILMTGSPTATLQRRDPQRGGGEDLRDVVPQLLRVAVREVVAAVRAAGAADGAPGLARNTGKLASHSWLAHVAHVTLIEVSAMFLPGRRSPSRRAARPTASATG